MLYAGCPRVPCAWSIVDSLWILSFKKHLKITQKQNPKWRILIPIQINKKKKKQFKTFGRKKTSNCTRYGDCFSFDAHGALCGTNCCYSFGCQVQVPFLVAVPAGLGFWSNILDWSLGKLDQGTIWSIQSFNYDRAWS